MHWHLCNKSICCGGLNKDNIYNDIGDVIIIVSRNCHRSIIPAQFSSVVKICGTINSPCQLIVSMMLSLLFTLRGIVQVETTRESRSFGIWTRYWRQSRIIARELRKTHGNRTKLTIRAKTWKTEKNSTYTTQFPWRKTKKKKKVNEQRLRLINPCITMEDRGTCNSTKKKKNNEERFVLSNFFYYRIFHHSNVLSSKCHTTEASSSISMRFWNRLD